MDIEREEELPASDLSQLAARVQRGSNDVLHVNRRNEFDTRLLPERVVRFVSRRAA
jgi:hypothetical protein